jgi:uncharacterized protein (DUF1330 family)
VLTVTLAKNSARSVRLPGDPGIPTTASVPAGIAMPHARGIGRAPMKASPAVALYPTSEQIAALRAGPPGKPVVMVNLLRFKRRADPPDDGVSGEEAFRRYGDPMTAFIRSKGARVIWAGHVDSQVMGEGGDSFDMIAVVEYPSREAFLAIATDPHVQAIGVHRAAGLEGQWLLAATTDERVVPG